LWFILHRSLAGDPVIAATLAPVLVVPKGDDEDSKRGVAAEIIDLSSGDDVSTSIVVETTTAIAGGGEDGEDTALDNACNKLDCFD
jgi:hypothetical protein